MVYKYYCISLVLHFVAMIAEIAVIVFLVLYYSNILLIGLMSFVFVMTLYRIWRLIVFPIEQVKYFLLSIRCDEATIKYPETKDGLLTDMYSNMNEILKYARENKLIIETKKEYYDRILSVMTHEIRNTVTPIIALSDFYMDNMEVSVEDIRNGISIINTQSKSLKKFLDSYHTLTHLSPPEIVEVSVPLLFKEMKELYDDGNHRFSVSCPCDLTFKTDAGHIRVVLNNLIRNAMQAIEDVENGMVELSATMCEKKLQITVSDNGCGISPEHLDDIFLPFYTTKQNGNGIGLSLCKQIMLLHDGKLTVESNQKIGKTVFVMSFPPVRSDFRHSNNQSGS